MGSDFSDKLSLWPIFLLRQSFSHRHGGTHIFLSQADSFILQFLVASRRRSESFYEQMIGINVN